MKNIFTVPVEDIQYIARRKIGRKLVKIYVEEELKLSAPQFLFRIKKTDIPEYLTEDEIKNKFFKSR